jgi:hypothetical protein
MSPLGMSQRAHEHRYFAGTPLVLVTVTIFAGLVGGIALMLGKLGDWDFRADQEPLDAFAHMRSLAGPDAVACGQIPVRFDPEPALACAEKAMNAGKPFWLARETRGIGADRFWIGFTRNARNQTYRVLYDHDAMGGWDEVRHPRMYTESCRQLTLRDGERPGPWCD